jgi:hypothetical protein
MAEANIHSSAVKHFKLRIHGERYVKEDFKTPSISFDLYMGNPQLVCWSEDPKETDEQKRLPISARTSWPRLRALLEHILSMVGKVEPKRYVMRCMTVPRDENGQKIPGPLVKQSEVHYGRNTNGTLYIEIRQKGRSFLPCFFKEDLWHELDQDGAEMTPAEKSDVVAVGLIKSIIDTYSQEFVNKYTPPEPRETTQKEY